MARRQWFSGMLSNDWSLKFAKSGHWRATYRPTGDTITIAATPSDFRTPKKVQSDIRRVERRSGTHTSPVRAC